MNGTTRKALQISGDSFRVVCSNCSNVRVFHYRSSLKEIPIVFNQVTEDINMSTVDAAENGYYFVVGNKRIRLLKKGELPYTLFIYSPSNINDDSIQLTMFDFDGNILAEDEAENIGEGIFAYSPTILIEAIVAIKGKFFRSFPNEVISVPQQQSCYGAVTASATQASTRISGNSIQTSATIKEQNISASVSQTSFEVE